MTKIKICGITNYLDAKFAAENGADALGFVFAPKSKRRADPDTVAEFAQCLPAFVLRIGVFQNQPLEQVAGIMEKCSLHIAQLHGDEDCGYMRSLKRPAYKAIGVSRMEDLEKLNEFANQGSFLLDSGTGGTGVPFDWSLAIKAKDLGRIILAGGLNPQNVYEAVAKVRPYAVDTASGVEKSPGVKDHEKVLAFIQNVRKADESLRKGDC